MKYIILETEEGLRLPIIFSDVLVHADVSLLISRLADHAMSLTAYPVSAGSINLGTEITCSGSSDTLKLKSRPGIDDAIICVGEQAGFLPEAILVNVWDKAKRNAQAR